MQTLAGNFGFVVITLLAVVLACTASGGSVPTQITKAPFGKTEDGTPVDLFTLRNAHGVEAQICNYGGIITSIKVPDRDGNLGDVVLGYDNLDDYLKRSPFFGAMVGRYGNRIAGAKFTLNGVTYKLAANNGPNSLHGGVKGFDKVVWQAKQLVTRDGPALELSYVSKDGEEGFPGTLSVTAVYTLTRDNALQLEFEATTDKETVVNLTQHSYFNLAGKGDVLGHQIQIHASRFTPVDGTLIPTGELKPVEGTPFDFRKPAAIGSRINGTDEQLKLGKGFDHNFVIDKPVGKLGLLARVTEPNTGRVLEAYSTEPGMQFYTGNFLDGTLKGKGGRVYECRSGLCLEAQHFPDSPNHPEFPTVVLKPGETYHNTIIFKFSTK